MDDEPVEKAMPTVGDQLRAARKKKKLSLEDIAAQTRIPQRHLQSLEDGDWDNLPAPTYTVGFAKSFAGAVDLDRTEIGEQLRAEMGDVRMVPMAPAEVFEPADPARTMPKWLVIGAIVAVLLIVLLMRWLSNRELYGADEGQPANQVAAAPAQVPAPAPASVAQGPVVLSATEPLWMAVKDKGGETYFAGILQPGVNFTVPPAAAAPVLSTAKPESLVIKVGSATAPAIGAPGSSVTDVSLLPADLMKAGAAAPAPAASPPPAAAPAPAPQPRRASQPVRRRPAPPPVQPAPDPAPPPADAPPGNVNG